MLTFTDSECPTSAGDAMFKMRDKPSVKRLPLLYADTVLMM